MIYQTAPDAWTKEACQFPIGFAQVREDPLLDVKLIEELGRANLKVMMIASGGCTAALLAAHPAISELNLADPNLSQLALSQLKLHLLENYEPSERLGFLGHHFMPPQKRYTWLETNLLELGLPLEILGSLNKAADLGLDFIGRYEYLFLQLQNELSPFKNEIEALLFKGEIESSLLNDFSNFLNDCINRIMALDNLVALYGTGATQNPAMPFWQHFFKQITQALQSSHRKNNPFLAQLLLGKFCERTYDWIVLLKQKIQKKLSFLNQDLMTALKNSNESFDFIHLSNALNYLLLSMRRSFP